MVLAEDWHEVITRVLFSGQSRNEATIVLPGATTPMPMTPEQRERMNALCEFIQDESDPKKFSLLVNELNALLESAGYGLESTTQKN